MVVAAQIPHPAVGGHFLEHGVEVVAVLGAVAAVVEPVPVEVVLIPLDAEFEDIGKPLVGVEERLGGERGGLTVAVVAGVRADPADAVVLQNLEEIRPVDEPAVVAPGAGQSVALDADQVADELLSAGDLVAQFLQGAALLEEVGKGVVHRFAVARGHVHRLEKHVIVGVLTDGQQRVVHGLADRVGKRFHSLAGEIDGPGHVVFGVQNGGSFEETGSAL